MRLILFLFILLVIIYLIFTIVYTINQRKINAVLNYKQTIKDIEDEIFEKELEIKKLRLISGKASEINKLNLEINILENKLKNIKK